MPSGMWQKCMVDLFWEPQPTSDGSYTFFSQEFGESFHSRDGARAEALLKFAKATDLVAKAEQKTLRLLDICYGLGYNTAAALEVIWAVNPDCQVEVVGLELDGSVPIAAIASPLLAVWSPRVQAVLQAIAVQHQVTAPALHASLILGDARQTIPSLIGRSFSADAIFFDPFSPRRCPQLWSVEFLAQVIQCLAATGKLATYSRSAAVRTALLQTGVQIGTIPLDDQHLPHEWSQGTVAAFTASSLQPLSQMEQEHLQTRAAVPYRDPSLSDPAAVILERHHQEQQACGLESTSSWRRRWHIY